MRIIFWFFLSLIAFIYFGYPLVLLIISFFKRKTFEKGEFYPEVEIVIPAHNEEKVIEKKLKNCLELDYPKERLKITVVLDACTDRTEEIILRKFRNYVNLIKFDTRQGKISGLNKAVRKSTAEVIFFNDADVFSERKSLKILVSNLKDERVGCVGGMLIFKTDEQTTMTEKGESLYWKYEIFLRKLESSTGMLSVLSGACYVLRRKIYFPIDEDLPDDFVNPIRAIIKKYAVIYEVNAKIYAKIPKTITEEFSQKTRMMARGFMVIKTYWKRILNANSIFTFEILFHKFLRWCVPFFLILIFILNLFLIGEKIYLIFLILQVLFYLCALLGYFLQRKIRIPALLWIPFYFCLMNTASIVGFYKFIAKRQTGIWEKPESAR